jgi:hypothetical protein
VASCEVRGAQQSPSIVYLHTVAASSDAHRALDVLEPRSLEILVTPGMGVWVLAAFSSGDNSTWELGQNLLLPAPSSVKQGMTSQLLHVSVMRSGPDASEQRTRGSGREIIRERGYTPLLSSSCNALV